MTFLLRSTRALIGSALLLPALAACDSATGPDDLSREQSRLDSNWDRFQSVAPLSYSYVVRVNCECPTDITRPVIVWVDRGSIEFLYYEEFGPALVRELVPECGAALRRDSGWDRPARRRDRGRLRPDVRVSDQRLYRLRSEQGGRRAQPND